MGPYHALLFANHNLEHSLRDVIVYSIWFVASKNEFMCDNLFINDNLNHWSKVSLCTIQFTRKVIILNCRDGWPKTSYIKSIGYWVLLCYIQVFYCLIEYCIVLSLVKRNESNVMKPKEDKNHQIALKIEKVSRFFVPVYLFSFTSLYIFIHTTLNYLVK